MRLFLIERTPLSELDILETMWSNGDVVACLRGAAMEILKKRQARDAPDIRLLDAESLIVEEDVRAIDDYSNRFFETWFREMTKTENSGAEFLMFLQTPSLVSEYHPSLLVRFGEICRKIFLRFPEITEVVSDITDGVGQVTRLTIPNSLPRATFLRDFCLARGIVFKQLEPKNPFPSQHKVSRRSFYKSIVKPYLGGFRLKYLLGRYHVTFRSEFSPSIYMFLNHGLWKLASKLTQDRIVNVVVDQDEKTNATLLRYDHFVPIPAWKFLVPAILLRLELRNRFGTDNEKLNGIEYANYFSAMLRNLCGISLFVNIIKASQMLRLLRAVRPKLVLINGESGPASRLAIRMSKALSYQVIYVGHGLNSTASRYVVYGCNHKDVTFVVPGRGNLELFGTHLAKEDKPRVIYHSIPITSQVRHLRGTWRPKKPGTIMVMYYGASTTHSVARCHEIDNYLLDIFKTLQSFISTGWVVLCQKHAGNQMEYIEQLIKIVGLENKVQFLDIPSFVDSLSACNLVISNVTTCLYQSLYAGWPTIFYQPGFRKNHFAGLIGSEKGASIVASNPKQLNNLVKNSQNFSSDFVKFCTEFSDTHGELFLGKGFHSTDDALAEVIFKELHKKADI